MNDNLWKCPECGRENKPERLFCTNNPLHDRTEQSCIGKHPDYWELTKDWPSHRKPPGHLSYNSEFHDPGGRSALRAGKRTEPCPTCGRKYALTREDVRRHYQCDRCADQAEGLGSGSEY